MKEIKIGVVADLAGGDKYLRRRSGCFPECVLLR